MQTLSAWLACCEAHIASPYANIFAVYACFPYIYYVASTGIKIALVASKLKVPFPSTFQNAVENAIDIEIANCLIRPFLHLKDIPVPIYQPRFHSGVD